MTFDLQISSVQPGDAIHAHLDTTAALECDWCGRTVSPETAVRRFQRGSDESQVVILCPGCENGAD
jgi:hypothetical protein